MTQSNAPGPINRGPFRNEEDKADYDFTLMFGSMLRSTISGAPQGRYSLELEIVDGRIFLAFLFELCRAAARNWNQTEPDSQPNGVAVVGLFRHASKS